MALDLIQMGERIRKQREYLNIDRADLAFKLNITPKFLYDIELGVKGISMQTLLGLSENLKLSTDYILKGETEEAKISNLNQLLLTSPPEKLKVAEELLKVYLKS